MSKLLINKYYTDLDRALQFSKSKNETSIRIPFFNLLNEYARKLNYELSPELSIKGTQDKFVRPDGIVKSLGFVIGLWESKDEKDIIDDEIDSKLKKGYPFFNILFEDTQTAILIQKGEEVMRVSMKDADRLHAIITEFLSYKSEVQHNFEIALENFKADIPSIAETLRKKIDEAGKINKKYVEVAETFLLLCKAEINPDITEADIREMLIQHILTSDIFNKVFDDPEFHRHNNIAKELEKLIDTLFTYSERKNLLGQIERYYNTITSSAASLSDHHEKQKFLKVLYENFYKAYNPKGADRLGVVYTPNEVVNFMIDSVNYLLEIHFKTNLSDKNVDILDIATGTGTFISSIIDSTPNHKLLYKYQHELHANEVAILPYYVANLNIEFTFKQKMGYYEEFKNLCFVDTLDNTDALAYGGMQHDLFGLSTENTDRIKNQNSKKVSVIIGNPPYNANQQNENDNNKNREYPLIDKRIKETYIKHSIAQKTKVYDMYARFYRWSTDRLDKNGILAFITNRSFIDSRTFDGFRKVIASEFNAIYIIDLGGDVRANPKLSGTKHNVFGIQTGVAIMLLVRKERNTIEAKTKKEFEELKEDYNILSEPVVLYKEKEHFSPQGCRIYYIRRPEMETAKDKLEFLHDSKIENLEFDRIYPDKNNNWINQSEDNDWEELLPLCSKDVKNGKGEYALFELFTGGIKTNRDEWVYDNDINNLQNKIKFFIDIYNKDVESLSRFQSIPEINNLINYSIKWSRDLKNHLLRGNKIIYDKNKITNSLYRPFSKKLFYFDYTMNDVLTLNHYEIFSEKLDKLNRLIAFNVNASELMFLSTDSLIEYGSMLVGGGSSQCLPLYRYDKEGNQIENITDWGLQQFIEHYNDTNIKREDIFHYTYAVLHNPAYRTKYELNLKREFPRLPFYEDFNKWAAWGKQLMDLHINYEKAQPYELKENTFTVKAEAKRQKEIFSSEVSEPEEMYARQIKIKPRLKADKEAGLIEIDDLTFLTGVPKEAWEYKLGNRSALEWILDQYKEKKPIDPTIAEKFNTYRFADYKEHVIDLLKRVCTVSVETMKIIGEMKEGKS
ncbi:MAG: type ISP restriction/modification enzyme, partial [Bacteroidota bacterium]